MRDVSEGHHAMRERAELEARVLALQRTVTAQAARIRGLEGALRDIAERLETAAEGGGPLSGGAAFDVAMALAVQARRAGGGE